MFPDLPLRDLTSFYHCLRSVYGVDPERSDETLDVIEADQPTADLLELPEGSPLVQVRRVTQDSAGRLIEWGEEIFVAERIRFHLRRQGRVRSSLPEVG
jgi:GntR family transcriptional regulator